MPLPIPEIVRDNVTFDVIAIGIPIGLAGYLIQESITRRRGRRRQAQLETRASVIPARRRGFKATESVHLTLDQLADDLQLAIDAMVDFVDGEATPEAASACAREVEVLVPAPRRGTITKRFLDLVVAGASADELQSMAEDVCVQLALELRALRDRIRERDERAAGRRRPRKAKAARGRAYGPVAEAEAEVAAVEAALAAEEEVEVEVEVPPVGEEEAVAEKPKRAPRSRKSAAKPAPTPPRIEDIEATLAATAPPRRRDRTTPAPKPAPVAKAAPTAKPRPAAKAKTGPPKPAAAKRRAASSDRKAPTRKAAASAPRRSSATGNGARARQ